MTANTESIPLASRPTPRTAEGKPDLTGVYGVRSGASARNSPPASKPGNSRGHRHSNLGPRKPRRARAERYRNLFHLRASRGAADVFVPYYVQFVQSPKYLVILHEYLHLYRVIPLDGSASPAGSRSVLDGSLDRQMGGRHARRRFDRVQESEVNGYRTTECAHVVERFRRPNTGTLEHEAVIEDPNVFAGPG